MIASLVSEFMKMRSWLAASIVFAAPFALGLLSALAVLSAGGTPSWRSIFFDFAFPLWCLFLLPMASIALTAFNAHIEHSSRAFEHLLAIERPRWSIFSAKFLWGFLNIAAVGIFMPFLVSACVFASAGLFGKSIPGSLDLIEVCKISALVTISVLPMTALQMWAALHFRSFIFPVSLGIGGVLVTLALAITYAQQGYWFPHAQPFFELTNPESSIARVSFCLGISPMLATLAIILLSRREVK